MSLLFLLMGLAVAEPAPADADAALAADPLAQELGTPAVIPGIPPGAPPPASQIDLITRRITLRLRCPVCQGLSVADSTTPTAIAMQRRVRELVAAGYTQDDIDDYMVSRYGEWILLDPRGGGLNQIIWLGPLVALGGAGSIAVVLLLRGRGAPSPKDAAPAVAASRPAPSDPHAAQLLAEALDEDT